MKANRTTSQNIVLDSRAFLSSHSWSLLFNRITRSALSVPSKGRSMNFRKMLKKPNFSRFKFQKLLKFAVPAVLVLVLIFAGRSAINSMRDTSATTTSDGKVKIAPPVATTEVNRDFSFPLRDEEGNIVETFTYSIQSAEIRNQIVVQGKRASSVEGRQFLIFNLKITNKIDQGIQLDTRDYVRLAVNGNEKELLAPEIHNDPADVQAISTKYTRLGFTVDEGINNYTIFVGEIDGEKEKIEVSF